MSTNRFRSLGLLTYVIIGLLGFDVILLNIGAFEIVSVYRSIRAGIVGAEAIPAFEQWILTWLAVAFFAGLSTITLFGWWFVRAYRNLPALGGDGVRFSPGWALGCFFVPVLNLWKPYQAMCDLVECSRDPGNWYSYYHSRWLVGSWWTATILGLITDKAFSRWEHGGFNPSYAEEAFVWMRLNCICETVASVLLAILLYEVMKAQHRHVYQREDQEWRASLVRMNC